MKITYKAFDTLPEEAKYIRKTVFCDEQGFVDEFNESDERSVHILLYSDDKAIGVSRIIYSEEHKMLTIGRFAILKEYRKYGYGRVLMESTEQEVVKRYGHIEIGVSAQKRAEGFYEKVGYKKVGEYYLDENYPHIFMVKQL